MKQTNKIANLFYKKNVYLKICIFDWWTRFDNEGQWKDKIVGLRLQMIIILSF